MLDLVLTCGMAPGDVTLMTAIVRDLHRHYGDKYRIGVSTTDPCLWDWNPYITPIGELQNPRRIECGWSLEGWHLPGHLLSHWARDLAGKLKLPSIPLTEFRGDIWLSRAEKEASISSLVGTDNPYWVLNAGNKTDRMVKGWPAEHFQAVIDALAGEVQFVQVGTLWNGHRHPRLRGVIDLLGKTDNTRDLIRVVHHSRGVLTGITFTLHLAAAVPTKGDLLRPCVLIAGGSEPDHYVHYPGHTVLSSVGRMGCCKSTGCWRRLVGNGKGPEDCLSHNGRFADCMTRIHPDIVVESIRQIERQLTYNECSEVAPNLAASQVHNLADAR